MGIISGLFKSRDKPTDRTAGSAYSFFLGSSASGKYVTERSAMQMTAVYCCVRILSEAVASLPLQFYRYTDDGGKEKAVEHPGTIKDPSKVRESWQATFGGSGNANKIAVLEEGIESTKTNAGTRKIPMTEEVYRCFQAILEDREAPRFEKMVDGYTGFLYLDDQGMPLVAMHWEHRFNHMVSRYNEIYRVQMPNITPHVCRHTYCSNQAKAGMNPKTLQYLMGHSDIGVMLNVYTHLGLEDAAAEMARMEEVETARKEKEKISGKKDRENKVTQKMFRAV